MTSTLDPMISYNQWVHVWRGINTDQIISQEITLFALATTLWSWLACKRPDSMWVRAVLVGPNCSGKFMVGAWCYPIEVGSLTWQTEFLQKCTFSGAHDTVKHQLITGKWPMLIVGCLILIRAFLRSDGRGVVCCVQCTPIICPNWLHITFITLARICTFVRCLNVY